MTQQQISELSYEDAIEELEQLVAKIEDEQIGVDDLTAKVRRASKLIELCRDKIEDTETEVEAIIEDLDEAMDDEEEK